MVQPEKKWSRVMFVAALVMAANVSFAMTNKVYAETALCPKYPNIAYCTTSADCDLPNYPSCNLCFTADPFTPYPCITTT
jgi:hypothetical protein